MTWEPWSRNDHLGLARYVSRTSAGFLRLPDAPGDDPGSRLASLYGRLCRAGIRYAPESYLPDQARQTIRTPAELLAGQGRGTCLDLAALLSGLCVGHDLIPVLIVLEDHAVVAVSATHWLSDWNAYDRPGRAAFDHALLTDADRLRALVSSGALIPVECTGFSVATDLPSDAVEGRGREGGLLSFERAVAAGREQLDRPLAFALDVAAARFDEGIVAHRTNDALTLRLGDGLVLDVDGTRPRRDDGPDPVLLAYPRPIVPQVPTPAALFGRSDELRQLGDALAVGSMVVLRGEVGSGRTTLLHALAQERDRYVDRFPDGVLYVDCGRAHRADVGQALLELLFYVDVPYRPHRDRLAHLLADAQVIVLLDDADDLDAAELDWLRSAMPGAALVVSVTRTLDADHTVRLAGMAADDAATVLAGNGEHAAEDLARIVAALDGHPADLQVAAALLADGTFTAGALGTWLTGSASARTSLVAALVRSLTPATRDVVMTLSAMDAWTTRDQVTSIVGRQAAEDGLRALRRQGLLDFDGDHVRVVRSLGMLVRSTQATTSWTDRVIDHVTDWVADHQDDRDRLLANAPLILRTTEQAAERRRFAAVATLVRAMAPALTMAARLGARGLVIGLAIQAGRELADQGLSEWAQHQLEGVDQTPPHPAPHDSVGDAGLRLPGWKSTAVAAAAAAAIVAGWVVVNGGGDEPAAGSSRLPPTEPGTSSTAEVPLPSDPSLSSDTAPDPSDINPGPVFPEGTLSDLGTVRANGFAFDITSVEAKRNAGQPQVTVTMNITNEALTKPTAPGTDGYLPPYLRVHGNNAAQTATNVTVLAQNQEQKNAFFVYDVGEDFDWDAAVLDFPVFGQGVTAQVPLGSTGTFITLSPGTTGSPGTLTSGPVTLTFYPKGVYRTDVALSDGLYDNGVDSGGLRAGNGSLLLYFDVAIEDDFRDDVRLGWNEIMITLPNGDRVHPAFFPTLISPRESIYSKQILATQVPIPARGAYQITFTCGSRDGNSWPSTTASFEVFAPE